MLSVSQHPPPPRIPQSLSALDNKVVFPIKDDGAFPRRRLLSCSLDVPEPRFPDLFITLNSPLPYLDHGAPFLPKRPTGEGTCSCSCSLPLALSALLSHAPSLYSVSSMFPLLLPAGVTEWGSAVCVRKQNAQTCIYIKDKQRQTSTYIHTRGHTHIETHTKAITQGLRTLKRLLLSSPSLRPPLPPSAHPAYHLPLPQGSHKEHSRLSPPGNHYPT